MRNVALFFILCAFLNTYITQCMDIDQQRALEATNAFQEFSNIQDYIANADDNNPIDYALFNRIKTVYPKLKEYFRDVIPTFLSTLEDLMLDLPNSVFVPATIKFTIADWFTNQKNIIFSQRPKINIRPPAE